MNSKNHVVLTDPQHASRLLTPTATDLVARAGLSIEIQIASDDPTDLDQRVKVLLESLAPAPAAFQRLQQLAVLGEMSAGVTHETRNLLTAIIGFAQMARQRAADPAATRRHIELIERESLRCLEILERFLTFAHADSGAPELVELGDVIAQIAAATAHQLGMKRIALKTDVGPELPALHLVRGELTQVVLNLVINAMHATPEGGEIAIGARHHEGHLEISVADTGSGVPPQLRDRIFEPFFTTKQSGSGTGLGLAVCRRIVNAAGGTIFVDPQSSRGARFVVRFPASEQAR
ncbi:MAG: sensory box sensor histidine kinase [Myxococcales bacterium]|nr:sensory box sensor histidine kinase [Myxococcales bacterium]